MSTCLNVFKSWKRRYDWRKDQNMCGNVLKEIFHRGKILNSCLLSCFLILRESLSKMLKKSFIVIPVHSILNWFNEIVWKTIGNTCYYWFSLKDLNRQHSIIFHHPWSYKSHACLPGHRVYVNVFTYTNDVHKFPDAFGFTDAKKSWTKKI